MRPGSVEHVRKQSLMCSNEVSDNFTPVDSTYTKSTLVGLHPNIMVQRSPSHFQTGTFYWSHVRLVLPRAVAAVFYIFRLVPSS